jgi:fused signal recognition particle receptor
MVLEWPPTLPVALAAAGALLLVAVLCLWLLVRRRRRPRGAAVVPATWTSGLAKTRGGLTRRLFEAWRGPGGEAAWLSEVEEILLTSDVGVAATRILLDELREKAKEANSAEGLRQILKRSVRDLLAGADDVSVETAPATPHVIVVVGVNGVGKTTTIGKLAHRYVQEGKKVLLVAGDTFRAAATEQLVLWAERVGADIVKHQHGADPSAVAFDGVKAAQARGVDIVMVDTAGRLHVKVNLMEELKKIVRTIGRQMEGAPHEVLLVIDATTGQNAVSQARVFNEAIRLTGVVLAKLDGTARGGIVLAIRKDLGLPICYVGLGERAEDLAPFDPDQFVAALFADAEARGSA